MSNTPEKYTSCPVCQGEGTYNLSSTDLMFGGDKVYDYYLCQSCKIVFIHPLPDLQTIASFYPDNYSIYDPVIKTSRKSRLKNAILVKYYGYNGDAPSALEALTASIAGSFKYMDSIPFREGGRMLDIGCGNGRYLLEMKNLGWQAQGVEFNDTAVKICRDHDLEVHQGDLHSASFADNSFDLITARHLIEHVPNPAEFIAEVTRILKPGGMLNLRTPNRGSLGRTLFRKYWFGNEIPRHLFLYNIDALDRLTSTTGLKRTQYLVNTSPKLFLNSMDYYLGLKAESSKRKRIPRLLAKPFVWLAKLSGRGDEIHAIYVKPEK